MNTERLIEVAAFDGFTGSIETMIHPTDKYNIEHFAQDDWPRFIELVNLLSPRDSEIMLLYAVLQKRPTDLSILFGKAGHRAEEDLHKAAHKLAGLIAFGPEPSIDDLNTVLSRHGLTHVGKFPFAAFIRRYARCRDFQEMARMMKARGWRVAMSKAFKLLHAAEGREAGLIAGWLLWLVDGSNPRGKGWRGRKRCGREHKLGPTVFRTNTVRYGTNDKKLLKPGQSLDQTVSIGVGASTKGGFGQCVATTKIKRHMKFVLRGMNA
jgi:hypothetical protein